MTTINMTIDASTRQISTPSTVNIEQDNTGQVIQFSIAGIAGITGKDITLVYVNYITSNGTGDKTECTDVTTTDGTLTFNWTVPYGATYYSGNCAFNIWIVADDFLWQSKAQYFYVSSTVDVSDLLTPPDSEWTAEITNKLSELITEVESATTNVTTLQADVTAAEETIATLQENVTTASTDTAALQTNVDAATATMEALQTDLNTASTNIATLQETIDTAEGDTSTLQTTVDGLQATVNTLEDNISTAQTTLDALNVDIVAAQTAATTATEQATIATAGATTATTKAAEAVVSADSAQTSATNASTSAAQAENARDSAEASASTAIIADDILTNLTSQNASATSNIADLSTQNALASQNLDVYTESKVLQLINAQYNHYNVQESEEQEEILCASNLSVTSGTASTTAIPNDKMRNTTNYKVKIETISATVAVGFVASDKQLNGFKITPIGGDATINVTISGGVWS